MKPTVSLRLVAVVCVAAVSLAMAATRAYFVEPKELHAGWTQATPNAYIGQSFVANVDSIYYIEWFVGDLSAEGNYVFDVLERATSEVVAHGMTPVPVHGWQWVRCDEFTYGTLRFTKGKEYLLKVSHSTGDSVNFVYRLDDPYDCGQIEVGGGGWGQSEPVEDCDLVCRVWGRQDSVSSDWWGANGHLFRLYDSTGHDTDAVRKACDIGIGWMRENLAAWNRVKHPDDDTWKFREVLEKDSIYLDAGLQQLSLLAYGSWDDSITTRPTWIAESARPMDPSMYPPRNLFRPLHDQDTVNYWAEYVDSVMRRLSHIKHWEVWNEVNVCSSYFGNPDTLFYGTSADPVDTPRERCRLYVRMCQIAKSIAREVDADSGGERKIVAGGVASLMSND